MLLKKAKNNSFFVNIILRQTSFDLFNNIIKTFHNHDYDNISNIWKKVKFVILKK